MKSAFMLAAASSASGKTTITCALLSALKNKGHKVKSFKCGPDYIDPMFHKKVLGIPSENLDLFFSDEAEVKRLFWQKNAYDVSLVEGVMGLYDGANPRSNDGSSYDLACKLDIPVVLVVNAHGMGRSIVALIKGFLAMDTNKKICGLILNQVSPTYFETIKKVIEEETGLEVFGYFPKLKEGGIESRYLGLKLPNEIEKLHENIEHAAETISKSVDIDRILACITADAEIRSLEDANQTVPEIPSFNGQGTGDSNGLTPKSEAAGTCCETVRIAVAKDEVFCFIYDENIRLLESLGAEIVEFSPIHDEKLPDNIGGLILYGGYPEIYARELSENKSMLKSIKDAIDSKIPSLAECGGFMYLHDSIYAPKSATADGDDERNVGAEARGPKVTDAPDISYSMVGAVKGSCSKKDRLVRFGYVTLTPKNKTFFEGNDMGIKAHEFHYYDSTNNGSDANCLKASNGVTFEAGHISENNFWGFAHLYYPSNKDFARSFVNKCRKWRAERLS